MIKKFVSRECVEMQNGLQYKMEFDSQQAMFADLVDVLSPRKRIVDRATSIIRAPLAYKWGTPCNIELLKNIVSDTCVEIEKRGKSYLNFKKMPDCSKCPFYNADDTGSCKIYTAKTYTIFARWQQSQKT